MKTLKQKFDLTTTEIVAYIIIIALIAFSLIAFFFSKPLLSKMVAEDGLVENMTAIMLFCSSMVCLYRVRQYALQKKVMWVFLQMILVIFFFFAAGEEISWGQRIFNVQSSEYFLEHNAQGETNLHNMVIGDTKINKLIFSQLLFVVLIFYFVFLELLAKRVRWIVSLIETFKVPLPKIHHTVVLLVATIIIQLTDYPHHSELQECIFAIIFFLIFLGPKKIEVKVD